MESFLVIGMGRFGSSLATELYALGHDVMIIDAFEERVSKVAEHVTTAMIGDAKDEDVLQSLGIDAFDCVVVAIGSSLEDSIIITLLLKELHAKKIVCKAQNTRHATALDLIGADRIVTPEHEMGKQVAYSLVRRNIIDHMNLSDDYQVVEINTPKKWVNKSILENNIRQKYGVSIMAIRAAGADNIDISFSPDVKLKQEDTLVIIGHNRDIDKLNDYVIED